MWYQQEAGPAESALADCLRAYRAADFDSCIRQSARVLELAEDDPLLVASVCWMRGGIEEMRGRRGLALRTWGYGLELARAAGLGRADVTSLLERSIDSLLDWPRVAIGHAPAEAALATGIRGQLEEHGLQCIDCPEGEPADEVDPLLHCLDRATVLFVLWSRAFGGDTRRIGELRAVHGRLVVWGELGAAPRLLLLRVDSTPLPDDLGALECFELGAELDGQRGAELAHLAREKGAQALPGGPGRSRPARNSGGFVS